MKLKFIVPILLFVIFSPAFGAISDSTGLREILNVKTGGHAFEIETVGNYNIDNHEFNKDEKRLTLYITSGLENNLGELILPTNLLGGNLTFFLNDEEIFPIAKSSEKISFITLTFTGQGSNKLDIFGTEYLSNLDEIVIECSEGYDLVDGICTYVKQPDTSEGGGCLIATATFDSEMTPQVQFLREIRDNKVLTTSSGESFMESFNQFYYSFSPYVADLEREHPLFKEAIKLGLTPMLSTLSVLSVVDIDSEQEMLGYGIGVILMNIGIYFIAPGMLIIWLKRK